MLLFMENLHQLLLQRHSIRRYTDAPVAADDVRTILEAALLSPSSKSVRPWQFVVVEDKEMLARLAACKPAGAAPVAGCAFAVVVTASPEKSECWLEDASIAAEMMQLQACDLGIGSCWVQVLGRSTADGELSEDFVQEALDIPPYYKVVCIMTFGYKNEERRPVDPSKLLWEKVHIGRWSESQAAE